MKKIDYCFDEILKVNYELYSLELFELKDLAKSWYGKLDLKDFDLTNPDRYWDKGCEDESRIVKQTGMLCNYFFAYKEDDKFYLMDGFNRLFTDYGDIDVDTKVYLKVITSKLKDHELMKVMVHLNLWKLYADYHQFSTGTFLDRGFRLFIFKKFGIKLYWYEGDAEHYKKRTRDKTDFDVLDYYFRDELSYTDRSRYSYHNLLKIFMNEKIIDDLKEIIKGNDYLKKPFNHYDSYLQSFVMFLSRRRLKGDTADYKFEDFLQILYDDDKYFKRLQTRTWTDVTRQSLFKFFQKIENKLDGGIK